MVNGKIIDVITTQSDYLNRYLLNDKLQKLIYK